MEKSIFFEYVLESGSKVIVSKDDEKLDDPRDIMRGGQIIWFLEMDEDTSSYEKEVFNDISKNDEYIVLPLYYTEKGIYTKEKFLSAFSGYYSISKNEVYDLYNTKEINDEVIDELMISIYDDINLFEKYVTDEVYQYTVLDENNDIIDQCGSFFDLDSCIQEGKRVLDECSYSSEFK